MSRYSDIRTIRGTKSIPNNINRDERTTILKLGATLYPIVRDCNDMIVLNVEQGQRDDLA